MATWASFTTIDDALTHSLTLALLGLEHAHIPGGNRLVPRYIGLREVPGAQPPDAVLGVCARGDAACPGHRLPLDSSKHALACCVKCDALVAAACGPSNWRRAVGAVGGKPTPDGWVCLCTCHGPAPPLPRAGDRSRPRFGVFGDVETAAADARVRETLGLSVSVKAPHITRARWIGLRYDTQPDGSRRVVGVCHAHNTALGCPGHALALRYLSEATASCVGCGGVVRTPHRRRAAPLGGGRLPMIGNAVLDAAGAVTGWICTTCWLRPRNEARRAG